MAGQSRGTRLALRAHPPDVCCQIDARPEQVQTRSAHDHGRGVLRVGAWTVSDGDSAPPLDESMLASVIWRLGSSWLRQSALDAALGLYFPIQHVPDRAGLPGSSETRRRVGTGGDALRRASYLPGQPGATSAIRVHRRYRSSRLARVEDGCAGEVTELTRHSASARGLAPARPGSSGGTRRESTASQLLRPGSAQGGVEHHHQGKAGHQAEGGARLVAIAMCLGDDFV